MNGDVFPNEKWNIRNTDYCGPWWLSKEYKELKKRVTYPSKKEIENAIKLCNRLMDFWIERRRKGIGFIHDSEIEEIVIKKNKLKAILSARKLSTDIASLRKIPISNFLEFKRGMASCPFHNEKTASLKYYPEDNHVFCFGSCYKRYDLIDIIRKINNDCSFLEAIKILKN